MGAKLLFEIAYVKSSHSIRLVIFVAIYINVDNIFKSCSYTYVHLATYVAS